jgi:hypothetical protein
MPACAAAVRCVRGVKCQMCSVGLSVHHRVRSSRAGSDVKYGVENSTTPSSATSPRIDLQNSTGSGTCSMVSHAHTTSNGPSSGASASWLEKTLRPNRSRAWLAALVDSSTPVTSYPRLRAASRNSPYAQPISSSREPLVGRLDSRSASASRPAIHCRCRNMPAEKRPGSP